MKNKLKISIVNYLNTRPFLYGIENSFSQNTLEVLSDIPTECANNLLTEKVDMGLVPIAVIPLLKESHIVSDYCIGADGMVKSVLVVSYCPISNVKKILLDYQSQTSSLLTRILAMKQWKIQPEFTLATKGYESKIKSTTAGLVIGDRAIRLMANYPYVYDLAEEWKNLTGLPFVFAAWVSNKKLPGSFINKFNAAIKFGIDNKEKTFNNLKNITFNNGFDIKEYFTNNISYKWDNRKKEAMDLFFKYVKEL